MILQIKKISILALILFIDIYYLTNQVHSEKLSATQHQREKDGKVTRTTIESASANKNSSNPDSRKHVVVVTLESAPFMMKRKSLDQNDTIEWYGYCMDFFNELIKQLPYEITYEIYQVSDNKFGSKSKQIIEVNGQKQKANQKKVEKWNGLIGDLQKGKADLALAPLAVMAERELAIDFTVPFYDLVGIQILLKKPEVPQDWFKFLTVLDNEVWFSITIAYFITSFVIFLFDRLSPYSHKNITRIQKTKQTHKWDKKDPNEKPAKFERNSSTISPINHSNGLKMPEYQPSNSILNGGNHHSNKLSTGDHLTRSHQLFVGSLGNPTLELGRRSSTFFLTGFDSALDRQGSDITTKFDEGNTQLNQQTENNRRGSRKFSDFFRGIDFRRSIGAWDADEGTEDASDVDDGKPDFGLRDSLWFCITSLTPQGGGEAPQNLSGRVVAGAWWLFCFIIIASYTANLAAFLTVSRLDIPIESLDDLSKQYRIKYAPVDGTAAQTYFERMAYIEEIFYNIWKDMSMNDSLVEEERSKFAVWDYPISDKYTKIWAQIQQIGMPPDTEAGIKRVKTSTLDDGFALLADANTVKHALMTDCSLKAVGDEFSRKPIALGVRKGDEQFKDDLSYAILKLINQRFMEILREKWWTNNPDRVQCDNKEESEGISIENIGGVFIIIFAGVVLSFFVWAIERFVYKTKIRVSQEMIQNM